MKIYGPIALKSVILKKKLTDLKEIFYVDASLLNRVFRQKWCFS